MYSQKITSLIIRFRRKKVIKTVAIAAKKNVYTIFKNSKF